LSLRVAFLVHGSTFRSRREATHAGAVGHGVRGAARGSGQGGGAVEGDHATQRSEVPDEGLQHAEVVLVARCGCCGSNGTTGVRRV
jgi:hypothetical protein